MTDQQQREAARQFFYKWNGKGREDEDARSYWIEILQDILGVEHVTDRVEFEKKVIGADSNTKRIDVYIPETKVIIEQKSFGIALDKPQAGHNGQTPYEQAKYYDNYLPYDEKARWIVTSNFAEIWIYDMNQRKPEALKIALSDLQSKYHMLDFLVNKETKKVNEEMELSLKAGEIVGHIYDAFLKQYKDPEDPETLKSLNKLCVRIVFCLYAEDAGVFGKKGMFHDYMQQFDAKSARKGLRDLFKVLDQKPEDRDPYLSDDDPLLAAFPYVNGGLFADEDIEIPPLTGEIYDLILHKAADNFDWSDISPTIFGAVFESTLNPETRRSGGMHYTSIENIHKVIDPLFLDDLKAELAEIKSIDIVKNRERKLREMQDKLASLTFLDPAAGSGNFLTESYLSIRKLENEIIAELSYGQISLGIDGISNPIKVNINQFYGIEINDFAVTVARTALWIAENQMMKATEDIVKMHIDFLPLKTNAYIVEGNALRIDWNDVVPKEKLSYIMGNPPFVGHQYRSTSQVQDMDVVFSDFETYGKLDYVAAWYKKATDYSINTSITCAFVSTNSICQGESVVVLWSPLFERGIHINFAYRTFIWDSEASLKAHVHCVIIGFSHVNNTGFIVDESGNKKSTNNINGYLLDAPIVFIQNRGKNITAGMPKMGKGSQPTDGGNLILSEEEKDLLIKTEPTSEKYIRRFMMGDDYINNKKRYCLWMVNANPTDIKKCPSILARGEKIRELRLKSPTKSVQKDAETPLLFTQRRQPKTRYMVIPRVSSQNRRYIPIGFLDESIIAGDKLQFIPDASVYIFGVLISNVHMAWMRVVAGRLKSDYSYSPAVYNNFPWPNPTPEQKAKIEQTAQGILDARAKYPDASLADLYDELTMPPELRKAHQANDKAVMQAYGMPIKETDEAACVAWLMRLYQEKVAELEKKKK